MYIYVHTHTHTYKEKQMELYKCRNDYIKPFFVAFCFGLFSFFIFGWVFCCCCFCFCFYIKLFEMGICLFLSQADSSEYALGQLPEHFHEVEEAGLSHWAAQAPSSFRLTDNGMKHLELLGKAIISCKKGNYFKQNKGQHKS